MGCGGIFVGMPALLAEFNPDLCRSRRGNWLTQPPNSETFSCTPAMRYQTKALLLELFSSALLTLPCFAQSAAPAQKSPALATIDGKPITDDDLLPSVQGQLRPLRDQEYQIKKKALENLINQKLLEGEAKKKGAVNTEKLLEQEVDSKVPEPTDAELAAIYAVQKDQLNRPFPEVKTQLAQTLKRAKTQQARQDYYARLREENKVAVLLSPPREQVTFDPARVRGNPKAKVMIVEFSDFQCPYCGQVQATLKTVLAKHPNNVALAFRDMPIPQIHPLAPKAAGIYPGQTASYSATITNHDSTGCSSSTYNLASSSPSGWSTSFSSSSVSLSPGSGRPKYVTL